MKKTFITASALILSVAFIAMAFIFAAPVAYASEVETIAPPTEEKATESEISTPNANETTDETSVSSIIDAITSSSLWISIGAFALSAIGIIAFVGKKTTAIFDLIKGKADKTVIASEIRGAAKDIKEAFDEEYKKVNAELEALQEKEKQMWAMLTIFMTHAKIPAAAKAEIMNCITGIKDMTGDIKEIVESAEKAICAAEKEAAENAAPTPALDEIINSSSDGGVMELG